MVGAGIIGATAALKLAGWQVTLCDGHPPGSEAGASYGNGGWISPASIIPMSMPGLWRQVPGFLLDRNGPLTIDWASLEHEEACRLKHFGFDDGIKVEALHLGPFGRDPVAIRVGRMTVAIRRAHARAVHVVLDK